MAIANHRLLLKIITPAIGRFNDSWPLQQFFNLLPLLVHFSSLRFRFVRLIAGSRLQVTVSPVIKVIKVTFHATSDLLPISTFNRFNAGYLRHGHQFEMNWNILFQKNWYSNRDDSNIKDPLEFSIGCLLAFPVPVFTILQRERTIAARDYWHDGVNTRREAIDLRAVKTNLCCSCAAGGRIRWRRWHRRIRTRVRCLWGTDAGKSWSFPATPIPPLQSKGIHSSLLWPSN